LAERISASLIEHGLVARTMTLKLRTADFLTITRSSSRHRSTASAEAIVLDILQLLFTNWTVGDPIRLIGVGASNLRLVREPDQLAMDI